MKRLGLLLGMAAMVLAGNVRAAILITSMDAPISVSYTDFVGWSSSSTATYRGDLTSAPTATQSGGAYTVSANNAVALVSSGTSPTPYFELTITNGTGSEITGLGFLGTIYQYKGNSGNVTETLTASVTGLSVNASQFNISTVAGSGNGFPQATDAYSVDLSSISLAAGSSFTIRWTDFNDAGTDAMFGLGGLSITAFGAVPEPSTYALLGIGMIGLFFLCRLKHKGAVES